MNTTNRREQFTQEIEGWVALVQAILFLMVIINLVLIVPQVFTVEDWVTAEAIQRNWPALLAAPTLEAATNITLLVITLAMFNRLSTTAPQTSRLFLIAGCIGCALLLGAGGIQMTIIDVGLEAPANQPALVAPVVAAIASTSAGLRIAAYFSLGWAMLLWGRLALQSEELPKPLAIMVAIAGVLGILSFYYYLFLLLLVPLTVVWSFWLGLFWLRGSKAALAQPA